MLVVETLDYPKGNGNRNTSFKITYLLKSVNISQVRCISYNNRKIYRSYTNSLLEIDCDV